MSQVEVVALRAFRVEGRVIAPGEVVALGSWLAQYLVGIGRAALAVDPDTASAPLAEVAPRKRSRSVSAPASAPDRAAEPDDAA